MVDRVDLFVHLDDVQYARKEWVNRNRVRSTKVQGWDWITASIKHGGELSQSLLETQIAYSNPWVKQVTKITQNAYKRTPYYHDFSPGLFNILNREFPSIADLNIALIDWGLQSFDITTKIVRSSSIESSGEKEEKLIYIINSLGGKLYVANNGAKAYIKPEVFTAAGIDFTFQDYTIGPYLYYDPQVLPPLCFLDLLFMEGQEKGLEIIRAGRPVKPQIIPSRGSA